MDDRMVIAGDNGVTTVSQPCPTPEWTESLPLTPPVHKSRKNLLWRLLSGAEREDSNQSLYLITLSFIVLTFTVIIALIAQINFGDYQLSPHGSVATDSIQCSTVGTDILKQGGNAVDAAVASTLCLGVVNPHVTGLGGGGFLLVYDHRKRRVLDAIDFRETAPLDLTDELLSENVNAGLSVGVPGFLRGLGFAHKLYGILPWSEVVKPSVYIARYGFPVPASLISAKTRVYPLQSDNVELQEFLSNLEAGKNLTMSSLADCLELIASKGADELYNGRLADTVLLTVKQAGGVMKKEDLEDYQPVRRETINLKFGDFNVIVPGLPSGGPFIVETLTRLKLDKVRGELTEAVDTLANAMRETFISNLGLWGDPSFESKTNTHYNITSTWINVDAVGSHVAAVDLNDLYVSVVSGLNTWFGSQLLANGSFVLNNAMKNFDIGQNSFAPGKRPLSSASPIIATQSDEICGRRLVFGVGSAPIGAELVLAYLMRNGNISSSMEAPRFHYNPVLNRILYEGWHKPEMSNKTISQLALLHYEVAKVGEPYQSSNLIEKVGDVLTSRSDSRGGGVASRF